MTLTALRSDRGSAVAEFVMVSAVVSLMFATVLQLGYALHVHNTATAHVIEGAREGARSGSSTDQGVARTRELLGTTLPGRYGTQVTSNRTVVGGVEVVQVSARLPVPLLGPLGPPGSMTVTGQAFAEDQ
ncbi:MAG: TadE family protein [Ornithinimicrobium sp.]